MNHVIMQINCYIIFQYPLPEALQNQYTALETCMNQDDGC